jgi:hypothetical protein
LIDIAPSWAEVIHNLKQDHVDERKAKYLESHTFCVVGEAWTRDKYSVFNSGKWCEQCWCHVQNIYETYDKAANADDLQDFYEEVDDFVGGMIVT